MKIIKVILAMLGLVFGVMLFLWLFGWVASLLWYGLWLGVIGAVGYGAYRLFTKAEQRYVGGGTGAGSIEARDFDMSWDEYERKYLSK